MAFDEIKENAEDLQEQAKAFLESNVSYYKLWLFKVAMKSTTMLLKIFLLSVVLVMVILFFSIAGALALGYAFHNFAYGFLIVGGFYVIIGIFVYRIKDKIVEGPVLEKFSEFFFND
ncbi:MAG: competence protein [Flavobacterium sp. BFFFF1]|uniref:competence protein n=1 Tax=Flavobacterium sp. BFFFF1 TaxID=2015557 RepID=UPI000BC50828|nr:competence protein [Flavobacterium sp. BFFFF1]OYU81355.1 MAG: competence protein [Flavobacterium sp. BFFFF1]